MHPRVGAAITVDEIRAALADCGNDLTLAGSFRRGEQVLTDALLVDGRAVVKAAGNLVAIDRRELLLLMHLKTYAVQLLSWVDWLSRRLRENARVVTVLAGCHCTMCVAAGGGSGGVCDQCARFEGECPRALCHVNDCMDER